MSEGWSEEKGALKKVFKFDSYLHGVNFAVRVAELAERMSHHPAILIGYRKVAISSTTHDKGNVVTGKDRELAGQIDAAYMAMTAGD